MPGAVERSGLDWAKVIMWKMQRISVVGWTAVVLLWGMGMVAALSLKPSYWTGTMQQPSSIATVTQTRVPQRLPSTTLYAVRRRRLSRRRPSTHDSTQDIDEQTSKSVLDGATDADNDDDDKDYDDDTNLPSSPTANLPVSEENKQMAAVDKAVLRSSIDQELLADINAMKQRQLQQQAANGFSKGNSFNVKSADEGSSSVKSGITNFLSVVLVADFFVIMVREIISPPTTRSITLQSPVDWLCAGFSGMVFGRRELAVRQSKYTYIIPRDIPAGCRTCLNGLDGRKHRIWSSGTI